MSLKYDHAMSFNEGLAAVKLNRKWGYIDRTEKEIIPFKYDYTFGFEEGLAVVELDGKWGYIDTTGKEVLPLKYDFAWSFNGEFQGLALVRIKNQCHYIDRNGIRWKYEEAYYLREGLAAVKLNGKWGYIDKDKNEVFPLIYDYAESFNQDVRGLAWVELNGRGYYIDRNGVPLYCEKGSELY
jgi:hypothetical protein